MLSKVTKAVNEFDPLDLLPYAPPDEYDSEIKEISSFLENNNECNLDILSYKIFDIFKKTLGDEIFDKSIEDCYQVARKILD
jgi:hypothetical protein